MPLSLTDTNQKKMQLHMYVDEIPSREERNKRNEEKQKQKTTTTTTVVER